MLEIKNLTFEADDGKKNVKIIDNISLSVPDGKFMVITGPNGGGKSTLARLIMGLEKPTEGQIIYNGTDITDMSVTDRAKLGIGYAFQQPPRFKGMTVRKMLSIANGSELSEKECCNFLAKVGLCSAEYVSRELDNSLSGGEMKRIEIATLMARKPKLAIFDEPEAGIDLWSFSMLVETFKNIQRTSSGTTIIISHQERIMNLADEMVVIAEGKIRKSGEKTQMLADLMCEFSSTPRCIRAENNAEKSGLKDKQNAVTPETPIPARRRFDKNGNPIRSLHFIDDDETEDIYSTSSEHDKDSSAGVISESETKESVITEDTDETGKKTDDERKD